MVAAMATHIRVLWTEVDALKKQLTDVDAAMAAIESGSYGSCKNCGKDIGAARLEFRPMSILCVDCKNDA